MFARYALPGCICRPAWIYLVQVLVLTATDIYCDHYYFNCHYMRISYSVGVAGSGRVRSTFLD